MFWRNCCVHVASGACSGGTVVYSSEWGMFWRNCCVHVASGACSGGTVVGHVLEELLCTVVSGACSGGTVVYM